MKYQKGSAVTTLLLLFVLVGIAWVTFDYKYGVPGDTIVERATAKPVVTSLDLFKGNEDQASILYTYHYLDLDCQPDQTEFGDTSCWAPISKFNSIEARGMAFFFEGNELSAVRIRFKAENHPALYTMLEKQYGPSRMFGQNRDSYGNNIVGWIRPAGIVSINDELGKDQDAILVWMSKQRFMRKIMGR